MIPKKKVSEVVKPWTGLVLITAVLICGCSETPKPKPHLVRVKIVAIKEHSGAMNWGDLGCTTVEYPNGTRHVVGGIKGKVGESFMLEVE